jgi:hypothetical protein
MSLFSEKFVADNTNVTQTGDWVIPNFNAGVGGFVDFVETYGGKSFNNGLYRVHSGPAMERWTAIVTAAFPKYKERAFCFSYDWLGRHFALDFTRLEADQLLILMFEPGTGQALELPVSFDNFHNAELVEFQNEALAVDFHKSWLSSTGIAPKSSECIGYKVPLFLGGKDVIENLELSDMEVYWSLCGQMLNKTRNLPDGTPIGGIRMD